AGAAPAQTEGLQALIEGARQEGQLSLVWGAGTMGGREGVARISEGFNRAYGLNVDVQFTIGLSFPEMAAKVIQEYQAGRRATTDILLGPDNSINTAVRAEALERVDWAAWAPNIRNSALIAGQGEGVTFQTWLPGITYSSSRVSGDAVPRSMQDLLKPQYKGRIASTPYAANLDRLAATDLWGKQRTLEYVRALSPQLAGLIRCNETERVVNGEFDIFALDCSQANTLGAKARGAPVEFTLASDVPIVSTIYLTVPKNAAHPNAAKLWINYVLGREVQDLLYQM